MKPRIPCSTAVASAINLFRAATVASLLVATAGRARADAIPGYVVLPLSLMEHNNQATLRVELNGRSTMLVLDTGASRTVLDTRFYQGVRSKSENLADSDLPTGALRHTNANGQAAEVGYIGSLTAGAMNFGKGPVLVTDLGPTLGQYNVYHQKAAIGGLIGEDILQHFSAIIDWGRRGVYFNTDPAKRIKLGPGLVAAGWTAIPMARTNYHHFLVPCTVSGKPVRLVVDTGAEFTSFAPGIVPLNVIYNRDTGATMAHLASTTSTMSMIGGDSSVHPARVENWKVGDFPVASSVVATGALPHALLTQQGAGDGPILGLLGAEFLAAHHAIVDIGGTTLYLKPK